MNQNKLEELKKSFIYEKDLQEEDIAKLVLRLNKICVIDKSGSVRFIDRNLSDKDKIKYILLARFVANKLDHSINQQVNKLEIENILAKPSDQVRARLSDLRKEGLIKDIGKSVYEIHPFVVNQLLMEAN